MWTAMAIGIFCGRHVSRSHHRRQVMDGAAFQQFRDTRSDLPQTPRNTLLMQQAKGHFAELARFANVAASNGPGVPFSSILIWMVMKIC